MARQIIPNPDAGQTRHSQLPWAGSTLMQMMLFLDKGSEPIPVGHVEVATAFGHVEMTFTEQQLEDFISDLTFLLEERVRNDQRIKLARQRLQSQGYLDEEE